MNEVDEEILKALKDRCVEVMSMYRAGYLSEISDPDNKDKLAYRFGSVSRVIAVLAGVTTPKALASLKRLEKKGLVIRESISRSRKHSAKNTPQWWWPTDLSIDDALALKKKLTGNVPAIL